MNARERDRNLRASGYERFVVHVKGPIATALRHHASSLQLQPESVLESFAFFELERLGLARMLWLGAGFEHLAVEGPLDENGHLFSLEAKARFDQGDRDR